MEISNRCVSIYYLNSMVLGMVKACPYDMTALASISCDLAKVV